MPVEQVHDNSSVFANRVYVIAPNSTLTVKDRVFRVKVPGEPAGHRTPIDSLFRSVAEDRGENAVCIMLSGNGTDGTLGLRAIKEHGGMAMAQTLESARYDAILRSAIATGLVDHVLPVEQMPAKLLEYASHLRSLNDITPNSIQEQLSRHMPTIHRLLRNSTGHDFSEYKENTIARRLERRMKISQIETVEQYVAVLEREPQEVNQLFKDVLIGVTQFFRDADAFDALHREVIPKLFEGKDAGTTVTVCVIGCSSGEEAYSIAMLLCEHASTLHNPPKIKIFATDIDERGLEIARKGRYPESVAEQVGPERLHRFFTRHDNGYQGNPTFARCASFQVIASSRIRRFRVSIDACIWVLNVHRASFSVDVLPVRSAEAVLFSSSMPTQSKEADPVLDPPHENNNLSWGDRCIWGQIFHWEPGALSLPQTH